MLDRDGPYIRTLELREQYRDDYWLTNDPIADDRLLWRAQTFRHKVHLLPSQTILELGCGQGHFTRQLSRVSRNECRLTCVSFNTTGARPHGLPISAEYLAESSLPGSLQGRCFDYVVAMDLMDKRNCAWMLQKVYDLLKPGGQALFYETNPWNIFLRLNRALSVLRGRQEPRSLLNRPELYELLSEIGFIRISAVYNDFVYRPIPGWLMLALRNLSTVLENTPVIRTVAGSILVHSQKPPRTVSYPKVSLFEHEVLCKAVSVVIPCHNEEMNIRPLIVALRTFYGEYLHEIIPVDDGSADETGEVIRQLAAEDSLIKPIWRSPPNGVGLALADGYKAVTGRYVLSMDCDFQHLLPEVRDIFDAAAEGHDVVIGSRFSRLSVLLNYPFLKIVANRGFHMLARLALRYRFRDVTNNLKLMRSDVIKDLRLTQRGFAVNAETGLQPLVCGYSVKEVPISWINRTPDMGASSFRLLRVGGGYCRVLFFLWLELLFGIGPYKGLTRRRGHEGKEQEKH